MDTDWSSRARSCMHNKGISQDRLAASLECTRGAVSHYLAGRRTPNLRQLEAIAACLEVPPWWLLYGVDDARVHEHAAEYRPGIALRGDTDTGATALNAGRLRLAGLSPPCYALRVRGAAYAPRMYEGEAIVLDPELAPQPGDDIVIRYKHHAGVALYNFIQARGRHLTVNPLLDQHRRQVLDQDDVDYLHTIVAVVRANAVAG